MIGTSLKTTGTYTWLAIKPGARAQPEEAERVSQSPLQELRRGGCGPSLAPCAYSLHTEQGVSELRISFCCCVALTVSAYTTLSGAMIQQLTSTYFSCLWVLTAPVLFVQVTTLFGDQYS